MWVLFAVFVGIAPLYAHTLKTSGGCSVNHSHYGYCGPWGCPQPDSVFEDAYKFRAADRKYSGTAVWNCHGRTFDAKQSWIGDPSVYLSCGGAPSCPVTPKAGDTILFYQSGKISHSVTITGTWNKTLTRVMSKYGTQGQYEHSLDNAIRVYGSNYYVTRFAGARIYSTGEVDGAAAAVPADESEEQLLARLTAERARMPWYEDVLASAAIAEDGHNELVHRFGALLPATMKELRHETDTDERIALLVADLQDAAHFVGFGAYDDAAFTEDYVAGMVAAKMLVAMTADSASVRKNVLDALEKVVFKSAADPARGVALFAIGQIATPAEREALSNRLEDLELVGDEAGRYSDYYGRKLTHQPE